MKNFSLEGIEDKVMVEALRNALVRAQSYITKFGMDADLKKAKQWEYDVDVNVNEDIKDDEENDEEIVEEKDEKNSNHQYQLAGLAEDIEKLEKSDKYKPMVKKAKEKMEKLKKKTESSNIPEYKIKSDDAAQIDKKIRFCRGEVTRWTNDIHLKHHCGLAISRNGAGFQ